MNQPSSYGAVWGQANHASVCQRVLEHISDALIARKGQLLLLCDGDIGESLIHEFAESYYEHPSFDILPCLRQVFIAMHKGGDERASSILLAAVVQGLQVYAVADDRACILLMRQGQLRELLSPELQSSSVQKVRAWPQEPTLRLGLWHLSYGDILVFSSNLVAPKARSSRFARALRGSGTPHAKACSLARLVGGDVPVIVLQMPGFTPVPDMGPIRRWPTPRPERAHVRTEDEPSPVRSALIVAAVAIALALWLGKPDLSHERLTKLLAWMLTSAPSATPLPTPEATWQSLRVMTNVPPTATRKPTPAPPIAQIASSSLSPMPSPDQVAMPVLLSPREGDTVHSQELALTWDWEGELADEEYFDVRLWRLGTPERSIAWAKEKQYIERLPGEGWHSWTVVVIRGRNGVIEEERSPRPAEVSFRWQPNDERRDRPREEPTSIAQPTMPPTPVPPTRVTPAQRPTRVTPNESP